MIDDSSDWDLEEGSVDFWLWLPASLTDNVGVISRDVHNREQAGHFSLFVDENGRAVARLQPIDDGLGDNSADAVVCSDAVVPRERWFHIGVNFGPPEVLLFVAGELVNATADTSLNEEWTCGFAHRGAIAPLDRRRRSLRFRT